MQAAVQAKMPRNQAFFGSFWADGRYVDCIKDNVQIEKNRTGCFLGLKWCSFDNDRILGCNGV